ncbi:hypothetical phage protein, partial [Salmonella phage Vi06]
AKPSNLPRHNGGVSMENKETKHQRYRRYCEERPFDMYCRTKKSWAKTRGIEFTLDAEYLESIWTGVCPILGLALNVPMRDAKGSGSLNTAHLDRFDPKKGYIKGNVTWVSGRANRIKYDATLEELKSLVSWMEGATTISKESTSEANADGSAQPLETE